jgi:hypothetical protein
VLTLPPHPTQPPRPQGVCAINKHLRGALDAETCVYTNENARFIHGKVAAANAAAAGNGNGHGNGAANGCGGSDSGLSH